MAEKVEILITAKDNAKRVIKGVTDSFKGLNKAAADAALKIGKYSALGLAGALAGSIPLALDAEQAQANLNQTLKSTGGVAGITAKEANDLADSLAGVTRYSDETIVNAESMLLTFTNIGEDVFPQATETLLDMGEKFGSVDAAAIQLGKALNDPVAGVSALREVGVSLTQEQADMVAQFVEMGDITSAQKVILDELGVEVGGMARAMGGTNKGKIQRFINQMVNIGQAIGGKLIGYVGNFAEKIGNMANALVEAGVHSSEFMESLEGLFGRELGRQIFEIVDGFVRLAEILMDFGISGVFTLQFWQALVDIFGSSLGNQIREIAVTFGELYFQFMSFYRTALQPFIEKHADLFIDIFKRLGAVLAGGMIVSAIVGIGTAILALNWPLVAIVAAITLLWTAWSKNFLGIQDFTKNKVIPVVEDFADVVKGVWKQVKPELEKLADWFVKDALPAMRDFVVEKVVPALEDFAEWLGRTWKDAKPFLQELALWFLDNALPAMRDFVVDTVIPAIGRFIQFLSDLWDKAGPKLRQVADWFITTALPAVYQFVTNTVIPTIGRLVTILKDIWDKTWPKLQAFYNWVMNKLNWLLNNVFRPLYNTINDIVGAIQELINWIGNIDLGPIEDVAGFFGGVIPGLETGGVFQGLAMTGEGGREYVYAPGGAMVLPNSLTEQLEALAGNHYNLTVNSGMSSAGVISDFRLMEAYAG